MITNLILTFFFIEDQSELLKKLEQQAVMDEVLPEGSESQNGDNEQDTVENPNQDENHVDQAEGLVEGQPSNKTTMETATTEETVSGLFYKLKFLNSDISRL